MKYQKQPLRILCQFYYIHVRMTFQQFCILMYGSCAPFPTVPSISKILSFIFQTLETREIGRLAIYAPIINSTMTLVTNLNMQNGLVVIGRKQTAGVGRHKNQVHFLKSNSKMKAIAN